MATTIGDGVFGIAEDETGFITHQIKYAYSQDETELENHENEVIGVTLTKEKVEVSIDGKFPETGPFSGKLGSILTLVNSLPDFLQGDISAGTTYVQSIDVELDKGEYKGLSVKAIYRPSLISA